MAKYPSISRINQGCVQGKKKRKGKTWLKLTNIEKEVYINEADDIRFFFYF